MRYLDAAGWILGAVGCAVAGSACDTMADAAGGWSAQPYRLGFAVCCWAVLSCGLATLDAIRGR